MIRPDYPHKVRDPLVSLELNYSIYLYLCQQRNLAGADCS